MAGSLDPVRAQSVGTGSGDRYEEAVLAGATTPDEDAVWIASIEQEFTRAFATLDGMPLGVSVFGSARVPRDTDEYRFGVDVGSRIARGGHPVITGGGPGLMEAANRGAAEAGMGSVGLTIQLPFEEQANPYATTVVDFAHFFVRKTVFIRHSRAFVVLPGGFGTLDELFEAITLIQTRKLHHFPVILLGTAYWAGLVDWIRDTLLARGRISPRDVDLLTVTDDLDEMMELIESARGESDSTP